MRQRRAELTALLLAAQIVSLCLLVAEADALGSQGPTGEGQLTSNEVMQKLQDLQITMRTTDTAACRLPVVWKDELLTNCKEATAISAVPWCFTEYNNKRRACTQEAGAVRPFTWFLKDNQGTDGLAGSLCSVSGAAVSGYKFTPCKDSLLCAPLANGKLAGTGVGFCNTTKGGDYERHVDMRPQYFLGHAQPQQEQTTAQKAAAKSVTTDSASGSVGAVDGLKDVVVSTRVTTTGDSCKLPMVYKGKLQTDCFDVSGRASCFVGTLDAPAACKPLGKGQTNVTQPLQDMLSDGSASDGTDGSVCKLYADAGANIGALNVTACAQGLVCTPLQVQPLVGSGFGYCSMASANKTGNVDAALPPTAGGLASLSQYNVLPRTTIIDERCRLPVVYGDSLLLDCVPLSQNSTVPECFVEGLTVVDECKPANSNGASLQQLLSAGNATDGFEGSLCSLVPTADKTQGGDCQGGMTCMPLTGPMSGAGLGYCTQTKELKGQAAAQELYVAQRTTASGRPCRLPLIYGGNLLLDCTTYDGKEVCFPEGGDVPEQCAPVQTPVSAALSTLMQDGQNMDGKRGSMCTDTERFKGSKVGCDPPLACEAMIGPMLHSGYGYCTDLSIGKFGMTGAMRAAKVAQRRTTAGVPCRLPLVYNGQLQLDCTPAPTGNSTQCYVAGQNTLQTCDAQPAGDPVKLPILMASGQAGDGAKGSICALSQNDTAPSDCSSPLWCRQAEVPPLHGSGYGWCTDEAKTAVHAPGTAAMSSSGTQAATATAATSPLDGFEAAVRVARNDASCRIPIVYRGSLELDCRDFNNSGVEQCFVGGMAEPQPCKPASATQQYPALTQALASGQALDGNEGSLCVLNTGAAPPAGAKSPFIPASAGGGGCNLGLNCLTLGGPLDGSGYGYCALTVDGQTAIKTGNVAGGLTGVHVAQRRTIEGNLCRLPVVYQGELVSNCRSLDGSSQLQCFVQGLEVVQDCADTRNYPTELAPAMLAAGRGTDGQEGSLCTAVLAGPDAAANKLVPCNTGLACLPLQAGGSAGSGVGYCTKLGLGQHTADGAAAIRVTTRKTTGGQSCRLPIVYKGQLITGCVPVGGVDQCFPGDFSQGSQPCAQAAGGYNMTTFASLLLTGQGADGKEGSLCDPKAKSGDELTCGRNLACVPTSKGALASAKFGYCAGGEEAQAVLGSAAMPARKQPECGPACIAGAAIGGAILAALVVSAAWWFNVRRTRAKRKSVFQKFEEGEFADISAAYGEGAKPKRSKPVVSIAPTRTESLSTTSPVHKSALPLPQAVSPGKPPRNPKQGMFSDTPSQPSVGRPSPSKRQAAYEPPSYKASSSGDTPASLIGPNLSALGGSQRASLTDSSPFAQSLERKSSRASSEEGVAPSGNSASSTQSHQGLLKKD